MSRSRYGVGTGVVGFGVGIQVDHHVRVSGLVVWLGVNAIVGHQFSASFAVGLGVCNWVWACGGFSDGLVVWERVASGVGTGRSSLNTIYLSNVPL